MSKQTQTTLGGQPPEEAARVAKDAAAAALENLKKQIKEETEREFVELIHELSDTDRSKVPQIYENPQHRGVIEMRSPTHPLYRRLPEDEREWRNPDSDHYMAEWLRGLASRDHGRMLLANEKLGGMFRANAYEGNVYGTDGSFSTGTGGVLIPRPMEAVVMIARDRVAKARRFVTIYEMTTNQHTIPTAGSMTSAMVTDDNTEITASNEPTLASVTLGAQTAAVRAVASKNLLQDSAYNIVTIFATRGGAALGVLEDNEVFKDGTGTSPHIQRMTGTAYVETPSGTLAYSDVLAMYYSVPQQYRDNAIWLGEASVLQGLAGVISGDGRPFYQGMVERPLPIGDDPTAVGTLLGKRVYEVPFTSGDLWFGDPRAQYAFGSRAGITVEMSEHARFQFRQIVWLITERFAGNNVDSSASQYATGLGTFTT